MAIRYRCDRCSTTVVYSADEGDSHVCPPRDDWPGYAALVGLILTIVGVWCYAQLHRSDTCAELCAVTQDASVYANHTCTCVREGERYVPPGGANW